MTKSKNNTRLPRRADQALYQYYRPISFDQVVGQEATVKTLQLAVSKKSVGHAILFCGPRGTGKTTVARILAHQVNGVDYQLQTTEDSSQYQFDIIEIDAASNRRIEEVRQLLQNITIAPLRLEYKVYIIDEFHMLSTDSFNALLKTLEEPPEKVIFILATTEIHKVPATIISRCQRFNFRLVPTQAIVDHLDSICQIEKQKISKEALEVIATASTGSLRDSLSILSQLLLLDPDQKLQAKTVRDLIGWAPREAVLSLLEAVDQHNLAETISLLAKFYEEGIDPSILANQLMIVIRDQIKDSKDPVLINRKIDWIESLLTVKLSQQPEITLETILIKQVVIDSRPNSDRTSPELIVQDKRSTPEPETTASQSRDTTSKPPKPKPKTSPEPVDPKSDSDETAKEVKPKDKTEPPTGDWSIVLAKIKQEDRNFYNKLLSTTVVVESNCWRVVFSEDESYSLKVFDDSKAEGKKRIAKLKSLIKSAGFDCPGLQFSIGPATSGSELASPKKEVEVETEAVRQSDKKLSSTEQFDQVF